ncbi:MAG: lysophospholipid acyltransferase family protein, partial [Alphaproteobacteria bacterium]|nr:lysophospholipid acyltransferase family protein [Alphaproteobacteria bacterium]
GEILILYPEGTRGTPERLGRFKTGIAHLAKRHPDVPVVPVFLHGVGKCLPKGKAVPVPFLCDVLVGNGVTWPGSRTELMCGLEGEIAGLSAERGFPAWA